MSESRSASSGRPSAPGAEAGKGRTPSAARPSGPRPARGPRRAALLRPPPLLAVLSLLLLLLLLPAPLAGQDRRAPGVPHAAGAEAGRLLVGVGSAYAEGASFSVSGLVGDLARLGSVSVAYGFASGAELRIEGDVQRVLSVEERGESLIELDDDVEDGTTRDVGDFRVSTGVRLLGDARGPAAGLRLEMKIPLSDEARGIGLNTTDFVGTLFGSYGTDRLRATTAVGVAILETPLKTFDQNDVLAYAAELLWDAPWGEGIRLAVGVEGRANTRRIVPVGLEDEGMWRVGLDWTRGAWILDADLAVGYAERSPDWELRAGVARLLRL